MQLTAVRAIVTGGGSGIGRAVARLLAQNGAKVVAADMDASGLAETLGELPGTGHATCSANITKPEDVNSIFSTAEEAFGGANVLINSAGILRDGMLIKTDKATGNLIPGMSHENFSSVLDVHLTGSFLCAQQFALRAAQRKEDEGVIVNISSVSRHGNMGQSNYSAAKAGIVADTKLWAQELAKHKIRVGAIAPGSVRTPMLMSMREDMLEKFCQQVWLKRIGEPEEIFLGVKFIIECGYFTGRCLDIDGGMSI